MPTKLLTTWLACAIAAATVAAAVFSVHDARAANAELAAAKEQRDALAAKIADTELKLVRAESRAKETEKDSGELLKAVAAVRAQPDGPAVRAREIGAEAVPAAGGPGDGRMAPATPGGVTYYTGSVDGRPVTVAAVGGAAAPKSTEEQQRLASERSYQQELAKKRAEEAKERAAFEEQIRDLSAEEKYQRLLERAARFLASADFQAGIRTYNQAMTTKPADVPVTEPALDLHRALQAQNRAVDVTLVSDGETSVSIRYYRAPMKLQSATIKMLPGNYEVRGQRAGYQEVVVTLQVRTDVPVTPVAITCTQSAR